MVKQKEEAVKVAVEKNNVQQKSLTAWRNMVDTMGDAVEQLLFLHFLTICFFKSALSSLQVVKQKEEAVKAAVEKNNV